MNRVFRKLLYAPIIALFLPLYIVPNAFNIDYSLLSHQLTGQKKKRKRKGKRNIQIDYEKENLVDIINELSELKEVNVILPQGPNKIESTVTLKIEDKVTLQEAWEILYTILDIAGYTLIPEGDKTYMIIKQQKDKKVSHFPATIFIGTPPSQLPDTDMEIRYVYFLSNLNSKSEELTKLLQQLLPTNAYIDGDVATNALIIAAKSNDIRAAMDIVLLLDQAEYKETVDIIQLQYYTAAQVAEIVSKMITPEGSKRRLGLGRPAPEPTYFSPNVRLIPEPRTNSLILMGKPQAVSRLKNFIFKYIDVELESGRSVLHVYKLQYRDARRFAPVLQAIVQSQPQATGQAAGQPSAQIGTERYFTNVVIQTDAPPGDQQVAGEGTERQITQTYWGGNKLIVACSHDDWVRIKALIEQLDTPEPQVIIQVLVADLSLDDTRKLASILRNPKELPFPKNVDAQAANLGSVIVGTCDDPQTLQSDLLGINSLQVANCAAAIQPNTIANNIEAGSTLIEVNDPDGQTWGIFQLLKLFDHTKIVSHPHVIATNNQRAIIELTEERLLPSGSAGSVGGTVNVPREFVPAKLEVEITPRISAMADTVNMHVRVSIEQFLEPFVNINAANDKSSRIVHTIADVSNGAILALGGLSRIDTTQSNSDTPLISRIPILGYLFKSRTITATETNLSIFISPIIIQPRLRGGVGQYTRDHISIAKNYSRESYGEYLFDQLIDPVTHFFFRPEEETGYQMIEQFADKDEFQREQLLDRPEEDISEEEGKILITQQDTATQEKPTTTHKIPQVKQLSPREVLISENENSSKSTESIVIASQEPISDRDKELKQLLAKMENPFLNT